MVEYNYSWRNGPQQPAPQVYVNNQNTFNDYLQTGLLAANLMVLDDIRRLLQEAATERKLRWWESVVKHRFPAITDPMLLEDAAKALMAWDRRETAAQQNRRTGRQYRYFVRGYDALWIFIWGFFGLIATAVVWLVTAIISESDPNWLLVDATAAVFLFLMGAHLVRMFVGYPPAFDPAAGSVICRQFRPGQRITSLGGQTYTVADWPVYEPERLRFTVPVERASDETSRLRGRPALTSDQVVWRR